MFEAGRTDQLRPELDQQQAPPMLALEEVLAHHAAGAVLLDTREPADFGKGHLRGAVNVGLRGRFAEWAADVLSPDQDVVLVGDCAAALETKVRLTRVGYDRVLGQSALPVGVLSDHPELIETSARLTIEQLAELRGLEHDIQIVDVRSPAETAAGTLPGAREIPLATLADSLAGLDRDSPVVTHCSTGYRSAIAASVLQAAGHRQTHSWQWWELLTRLGQPGETTVRARATDLAGRTQPEQPGWNRLGYGGNAVQVIAVRIE